MKYFFLINPVAGQSDVSGEIIPLIRAEARNCGIAESDLHIEQTRYAGHAQKMAHDAAQSGFEVRIYTVGGDGTFNEALCGAMEFSNASVGCLPYGSGNDFLRSFGTKEEFRNLKNQLMGGTMRIDMIRTQRGFAASICSAGLDAQVAYDIPALRRIPFCGGEAAYRLSLVKQLFGHRSRRLQFTVDGATFVEDCLMVAVCNGRAYGGGFMAAPEARLDDGVLDVLAVRNIPLRKILSTVPLYQKGEHFKDGAVIPELANIILYHRAKQVEIHAVDNAGPMIVNVDGECGPDEVLRAEVLPLAGRVLLPAPVFARYAQTVQP
jgi:YegS/Rv2252/BmrU family lipid kinase